MHLFALLTETARGHPDADAFITEDARCTYSQMHESCCGLAAHLHKQGVRRGTRVALVCRNKIPFANAVFALLRLGAVCVPLNWRLTPKELSAQLKHAGAAYLLHDDVACTQLPSVPQLCMLPIEPGTLPPQSEQELPRPPEDNDPACIIYTAGTSDDPSS